MGTAEEYEEERRAFRRPGPMTSLSGPSQVPHEEPEDDEHLPTYTELPPSSQAGPSSSAPSTSSAPSSSTPAPRAISHDSSAPSTPPTPTPANNGPTVTSPFNFPSNADLPPYIARPKDWNPVAIPQKLPDASSPFIQVYAPDLLSYGITRDTWLSFVATLSGFLTATVSERAMSHAGDVARHLGGAHRDLGKDVASHAKAIGRTVTSRAKEGNIIGSAVGAVGGVVGLTVGTTLRAVGSTLRLPGMAIGTILTKKPRTPRERVQDYLAVANEEWFNERGLHALLLDTTALERQLGRPTGTLLRKAWGGVDASTLGQLGPLEGDIARLELKKGESVELAAGSLWIVVVLR